METAAPSVASPRKAFSVGGGRMREHREVVVMVRLEAFITPGRVKSPLGRAAERCLGRP